MQGLVLLFLLLSELAFDVGIDRIQLLHQAELVVIVLGIVDLIL